MNHSAALSRYPVFLEKQQRGGKFCIFAKLSSIQAKVFWRFFIPWADRRMGILIEMGKSSSVPTMARHGYSHFFVTSSKQQREMKETHLHLHFLF